jgi:ATP-dependent Lhr-like helicase
VLHPLGFVANEYALAVWAAKDMSHADMDALFDQDMLGDDLDSWLAESNLYKRTFRNCAIIAGLIERRMPGKEKTGRQVTFSSDLIYDVLRAHEPDHVLLRATYADAGSGLLDIARLGDMLARIRRRIVTKRLDRVSPLAVPALLEISREMVARGEVEEEILRDHESSFIAALIYSSPIFTMILSYMYLNEILNGFGVCGILCMVLGIGLISMNNGTYRQFEYFLYV